MIDTVEKQEEALCEPFPKSVLKKNPKGMTYIPVSEAIMRLNNVLGMGNWDYEVLDVREAGSIAAIFGIFPKWICARVRLTVRFANGATAVREGNGGQEVQFVGGEKPKGPVDLGDVYKGAVSDALKKAAQGFGVAMDLARTEEAMAAEVEAKQIEAESKLPKARPEDLKALKEYVVGNPEKKDEFNAWWKENVGKKLDSGRVTEEEARNAMEFLGIQPF